jgi:type IV pilus assembly protein PilB
MKDKYMLGEILLNKGLITKDQMLDAISQQKKGNEYIGKVLIDKGYVSHEDICQALSEQLNIKYVKLADIKIDDKVVYLLPDNIVREHMVLPIGVNEDELIVAMSDPLNFFMIQHIKDLSGYRITPVITSEKELDEKINTYFGPMRKAEQAIEEISSDTLQAKKIKIEAQKEKDAVSEKPVIRLVNSIVTGAVEQSASDIHLEPGEDHMSIRYRIDGILYDRMRIPKNFEPKIISRIKIMSGMDIAERRRPQDGKIRLAYAKRELDLRVSTLPVINGEKVVIRILDKSSLLLGYEKTGMTRGQLDMFNSFIQKPYGIILVTGPTGSGKTTTLYGALSKLNTREKNIITIEDPVEYEIKGINQVPVNTKAGITFARGMRHIVRQDPDIVMIGEIRDIETAEIAINAALTGHLVFSTLHTNDAPGAIIRLLNMNVEPFLIASSVIGVIAQRLVRVLCPYCKKTLPAPRAAIETLQKKTKITGRNQMLSEPVGCEKCGMIGYKGRTGIFEIMNVSDAIRDMILARKSSSEITERAVREGMSTLLTSGIQKALDNTTSLQETLRVVPINE